MVRSQRRLLAVGVLALCAGLYYLVEPGHPTAWALGVTAGFACGWLSRV